MLCHLLDSLLECKGQTLDRYNFLMEMWEGGMEDELGLG